MKFDDLDRIFPIVDGWSAQLMKLKALCLYDAGVITAVQKIVIDHRADAVLFRAANMAEREEPQALKSLAIDIRAARRHAQKMSPTVSTGHRYRNISIPNMWRGDLERSG